MFVEKDGKRPKDGKERKCHDNEGNATYDVHEMNSAKGMEWVLVIVGQHSSLFPV